MMNRRLRQSLRDYFRPDLYRRLFPYVGPYKLPMLVVIVLEIGQTVLALLEPWPMKILIDHALSGHPVPDWLKPVPGLTGTATTIVLVAVLGGLALKLFGNALDLIVEYLKNGVRAGMTFRFAADMFRHLQRLSFAYHDRTTVGDSIYRVNNDTSFVATMIWSNFRHLFKSSLALIGMAWIVLHLDWTLAVIALAVAPIQYVSIGFYSRLFKERSLRVRRLESTVQTIIQEVLACLRVVKAFGQESREQERLERHGWVAVAARRALELRREFFSQALGLVSRFDQTVILLIGALHVVDGRLTIGELMVVLTYVGQIHAPIESIGDALTNMQSSVISAERAFEVLDIDPDIKDRPGAKRLDWVRGEVAFEDVTFEYRPGQPVLRDVSFAIQPGMVVALVGPTGAGKTTIANLVARFYDPSKGRVTLDGHGLRDLTVSTLRDNIALVLQEPILFSGSIRDNIAYGRPDAPFEDIVTAAQAANAHDFITALPEKYDSHVGERGVQLSGGERQRLAMARAFLKNAAVLILDEPTSSVDSRTELVIIEALERLMVGRTTFIIAHRLSTTRAAHQILVVDKGQIVECGTHEVLLRHNGLYAQLCRIQSGAVRRRDKAEIRV